MKLNSRPKSVVWHEHKICFMHVNKAASNSINHAMGRTFGPPDEKVPAEILPHDYFIFSFVRNPWERIVSSYAHNIVQGKLTGPQKARGFTRRMDLPHFVGLIIETPDKLADKHTVSQTYRLANEDGEPIPSWVGKVENIGACWGNLSRMLNVRTGRHLEALPWMKNRSRFRDRIPPNDLTNMALRRSFELRFRPDYIALKYEVAR